MSHIQSELGRIQRTMSDDTHEKLRIAQQALVWAQDPKSYMSPFDLITGKKPKPPTGIPVDLRDC